MSFLVGDEVLGGVGDLLKIWRLNYGGAGRAREEAGDPEDGRGCLTWNRGYLSRSRRCQGRRKAMLREGWAAELGLRAREGHLRCDRRE